MTNEQQQRTGAEDNKEARGKGGSAFYFNVDFIKPNRGIFWVIFLILAISSFALWWFGVLKVTFIIILQILLFLSFFGLIFWGFKSGIKNKDDTSIFIALAFLIWAIDLLPSSIPILGDISSIIGPPYSGFEFDLAGTLSTNWAAIITSGLVFVFLIFSMFSDLAKKRIWSFFLSISLILVLNQIVNTYYAFQLQKFSYINYIFLAFVIITGVLLFVFRHKFRGTDFADYPTFLLMTLVFSFFWVNIGWIKNVRALIHVIYILAFGFFYVARKEQNNSAFWHILIPLLLIADFYGYGILWNSGYDFLKFIPILVLFVLFYCRIRTENTYALVSLIFVMVIFLIFTLQGYGIAAGGLEYKAREGANYKDLFTKFGDNVRNIIESQLQIATAGLYRGNVEKNRYESLGVYFANLRAADPRFYTTDPITVWGSIRSKTYKDAVIINFSCYRWKDNKKIRADKIIPSIKFPIFTLDEVDTECTFLPKDPKSKDTIPSGSNIVTFSAEYNFGTDAYLKSYFIDRERFKSYAKEDIDPLTELGIKDKKPMSIFTNGPVEIGISAGPLVSVSEGYTIKPSVGITLSNRQEIQNQDKKIITKWEGKIKNITELILLVPPGITLDNIESCKSDTPEERLKCPCSMPFVEYTPDKCGNTCVTQINNPCKETCFSSYENQNEQNKCNSECDDTADNCIKECDFLFATSGESFRGSYRGYALDVGSLEFKDLNKDIDKHRSFVCRFNPSPTILDNTPITTRYFRVRARYNYLLENSVTVNVEQTPVESITTVPDVIAKTTGEIKTGSELYFEGFTPELIAAIASVESRFRHCCQDAAKNRASNCIGSGQKECQFENLITSGSSYGIMQIKYNTDESKKEVNDLAAKYCEGKSITDYDCNVKVGIAILKSKFDTFKNGCKETPMYKSGDRKKYRTLIPSCEGCTSTIDGTPYSSYRNVEAAIRGYNGWGCDNRFDRGYVEEVKRALNTVKGAEIIDPITLRSIIRGGEGMYDVEPEQAEEQTQKPLPPTNPKAEDTKNARNSITISWTASPTPNVRYLVYRYKEQSTESLTSYDGLETKYVDINADDGVSYYYKITAYNDLAESDSIQTNSMKSTDDASIIPPVGGTT